MCHQEQRQDHIKGFGTLQDGQESLDPAELRLKSKVPATLLLTLQGSEERKVALLCDLRPGHAGPVEVAQARPGPTRPGSVAGPLASA